MTDLDIYQPAAVTGYQPGMVMTPGDARALDEQVRRCTEAVLREGTDYGVIPGTSGEKTLWRPGAQKLLQWFGLGYTCERVEVERDDEGRKHGITYKCTVGRRLPDGSIDIKATCEGTADYDESKFCQSAEEVQRKAEAKERMWAEKDRRVANPTKWKNLGGYRADWNALMKRAQKRAIVGAVVDATAAGGIFADREEDESPVPQDDGPTWYEQALEDALTFTEQEAGRKLFVEAAKAAREGLCTPRQANHVQNRITQRARLLKKATPVNVEDLARQAAEMDEDTSGPAPSGQPAGQEPAAGAASDEDAEEEAPAAGLAPGEAAEFDTERHRKLVGIVWQHAARLGYPRPDEETDEQTQARLADIARLAGVSEISSTSDLDLGELSQAADALAKCKDRAALDKLLKTGEVDG